MLRLYNTASRKKEPFNPEGKHIKLYTCGPTVHDYVHIGNLRTFVFQDTLRRWLEYKGYEVEQIMNITDVDEKTLERAKRKRVKLTDITSYYERAFFEDIETMNIERAEHYPKASEHVEEMVEIARKLLDRGYAFKAKDGTIYFDVNSFPGYGSLSRRRLEKKVRRKSKREDIKRPANFALWIPWDGKDVAWWETELGKGRPGWHSECCAMALKYFGECMHIHSGGVDLIFPHHENSKTIAEALSGREFSRYWLHCEHLLINGEKMSKSLRNYYTLRDMLRKGYSPMALRLMLLSAHYQSPLNFSRERMEWMEEKAEGLKAWIRELRAAEGWGGDEELERELEEMKSSFEKAMDDDINTEKALEAFFDFFERHSRRRIGGRDAEKILEGIEELDKVLGILKWV